LAVILAGTKLSKYGDVIAVRTGLGQALVGGILMAGATSLPELVTSSTASLIGAPDIAIGNVYGSNTFNLMILAVIDLFHGPGPFLLNVQSKHILSALLGILLSAIGVLAILSGHLLNNQINFLGIGLGSLAIIFTYIVGVRLVFRYEKKNQGLAEEEELTDELSLREAIIKFIIASIVIIFAGIKLSQAGDQIATLTGLERTFIGSIFVAAATSLPEMVATVGAIKINAYDMAVGNVLGSNIFNMTIIIVADLFYRQGPVLTNVSLNHTVTAIIALILSSIVVIGLFYRSKKTFFNIGWDSFAIIFVYLLGVYLLFNLGINF
jgi:cation:H+ antiporter